ncbi:DsrE family protein [Sphingomicrobium arenosum]|uniref:DsrE family protein n=1 Tax=Sphingomicrobium arenosum TaxID=2233861 RepID=UPI002240F92E|nr:DsrE family protein [Sphingomicrobium arenosum]
MPITAPALGLALVLAQPTDWPTGPIIDDFGPHAAVEGAAPLPPGLILAHAFDSAELAEDHRNRTLGSVARFINMHGAAGVPAADIRPAVVIHGAAVFSVVSDARFEAQHGHEANPNRALVEALLGAGTRIIVCGQSAAAQDVDTSDLMPGVEMALSAMTAHALLQREGYTLNPF